MTDISAREITQLIKAQLAGLDRGIDTAEVGTVLPVGDGIARVYGLDKVMAGELLEFPNDVFGLALNLEEEDVGCVLMGDTAKIREGHEVRRTKRIISVPVGPAVIGRVVDPQSQEALGKHRVHRIAHADLGGLAQDGAVAVAQDRVAASKRCQGAERMQQATGLLQSCRSAFAASAPCSAQSLCKQLSAMALRVQSLVGMLQGQAFGLGAQAMQVA